MVLALGHRSAHLPDNSYCEDFLQFVFFNNHPVLSICCFDFVHPVRLGTRLVILLCSFSMNVVIFNALFAYFQLRQSPDPNFDLLGANSTITIQWLGVKNEPVGDPRLVLAFVGAFLSSPMDLLIWEVAVLPCCLPGHNLDDCRSSQKHGVWIALAVFPTLMVASLVLVLTTSLLDGNLEAGNRSVAGQLVWILIGCLLMNLISVFAVRVVFQSIWFLTFKHRIDFERFGSKEERQALKEKREEEKMKREEEIERRQKERELRMEEGRRKKKKDDTDDDYSESEDDGDRGHESDDDSDDDSDDGSESDSGSDESGPEDDNNSNAGSDDNEPEDGSDSNREDDSSGDDDEDDSSGDDESDSDGGSDSD
jgi:hypothetical protein